MSSKKGYKTKNHLLLAKLADRSYPCVFCQRDTDDEVIYGKLYAIGNIHCHYFCVLLSSCLVQTGKDNEGLFGFLYPNILTELERSKKHKCSYCGREGATLGCSNTKCRKQFHLPCGRERDAVSMFFGNYKTFCKNHAPVQKINKEIMQNVKLRLLEKKQHVNKGSGKAGVDMMPDNVVENLKDEHRGVEAVCVICYEAVEGYPTVGTFWPPCCARDAWFHRNCLQRMALSAGVHYLKCPLCNQKETFLKAVLGQGYYVPDRDAAWELEQNAFSEIYERVVECGAPHCACPNGRDHDADEGSWGVKLCILCGSSGVHVGCLAAGNTAPSGRYVCATCSPVAPEDIDSLAETMETAALQSEAQPAPVRRPVMPCRMSLRRTKQRTVNYASSTSNRCTGRYGVPGAAVVSRLSASETIPHQSGNTITSRLELNLKTPKKVQLIEPEVLKSVENKLLSPLKMLEQGLYEKLSDTEMEIQLDAGKLIEVLRERLKKPKPLVVKKKIVNELLDDVLGNLYKEKIKTKEPVKEWMSPKKCANAVMEAREVIQDCNPVLDCKDEPEEAIKDVDHTVQPLASADQDLDLELDPGVNDNRAIKFSPINKDVLQCNKLDIDVESFKLQYLNEVDRDYSSGNDHKNYDGTGSPVITDCTMDPCKRKRDKELEFPDEEPERKRKRKSKRSKIEVECKRNDWEVRKSVKIRRNVRKDIQVKIKWRKERLRLKITEESSEQRGKLMKKETLKHNTKSKLMKMRGKMMKELGMWKEEKVMTKMEEEPMRRLLKQYILKCPLEGMKSAPVMEKPEHELTPMKRKYKKNEKHSDGLVQTSLLNFFKPET